MSIPAKKRVKVLLGLGGIATLILALDGFYLAHNLEALVTRELTTLREGVAPLMLEHGSVRVSSWNRIEIDGFRLFRMVDGQPEDVFASNRITAHLNWRALLRGRVDEVVVEGATLALRRDEEGNLNIPAGDRGLRGGDLPVEKIRLKNMAISIEDQKLFPDSTVHHFHAEDLSLLVLRGGEFEIRHQEIAVRGVGMVHVEHLSLDPREGLLEAKIRIEDLDLEEALSGRLPKGAATSFYEMLRPSGRLRLDIDVLAGFSGEEPSRIRAVAGLREVRIRSVHFPYPVEDLAGTFELVDDLVKIDLTGSFGDGDLKLNGEIRSIWSDNPDIDLEASIEELVTDKVLRDAFEVADIGLEDVVDLFNLRGPFGRIGIGFTRSEDRVGKLHVELIPRRVSMAFTDFPYQIEEIGSGSLDVDVVFSPDDPPGEAPITVRFRGLYGRHGEGRIRGDGSWIRTPAGQALDLRILAEGVDMAPDLGEAIGHLGEEAKEIWDRLNPSGGANIVVAIQRDPDGELRHQIEVDLLGSAVHTRDERVQLEDITGHLTLDSEGLKIRDLKCKHGGGWILANGEATSVESRFSGSLRIEFNRMTLDEAFRRLLPEEAHAIYDRFQPSGELSGVVELLLQPEGEAVRFTEIRVYPQGARILYDACPYPIDQLRGEVRVDVETGKISIPGLFASLEGGGEAIIRGEVLMDGAAGELDLQLAFTGLPLDETLRWAISEGGQAIWDQLDPGGLVQGEMRVSRKGNGPLIVQGDLKLMGATARPVDFPLRIRGLEGTVRVDLVIPEDEPLRGTVTLGGDGPIRGRREEAVVLISGDLDLRGGETTGNVRVQAMDLRVDPVLRSALPPEAREQFDNVEPQGWADVDVVLGFESGEVSVEWEARATDVKMRYRDFPIPIYGAQGVIRSRGDGVEIVGVRGHIGKDATIEVSGTSSAGGEVLQLWIRAHRLPLVERVRKLLPASVAETWSDLGLKGEADLDLRLRLEGGVFLILAEAEARGMSISFGPEGLRFDDLTGRLQGTATVFMGGPSTGRAEVQARISNVAGAFKERRIEDLSTNLWYRRGAGKNAKGELSYRAIYGKIIGGLLTGTIWLELGEELKYRGHLHLVDGRLEQALATHEKSKNATGKVAAELDFHGTGGDPESTSGWGKVEIRKGDFLKIPAISSLPVELTDQKTFDEMTIDFTLGATQTDVNLVMSSKVLSLIGRGTVGYDGSLDIVMVPELGRPFIHYIPVLGWLWEWVKGTIAAARVEGTLEDPDVHYQPFPTLTRALEAGR